MEGRSFPSSLDFSASAIEAWQSGPVPLRKAKTTCPKLWLRDATPVATVPVLMD